MHLTYLKASRYVQFLSLIFRFWLCDLGSVAIVMKSDGAISSNSRFGSNDSNEKK